MIDVVGVASGVEVARFRLAHGADPAAELAARGWAAGAVTVDGSVPRLTLSYAVRPTAARPAPSVVPGSGERRQRLAAYALVRHEDAILLTQLSERVVVGAGLWVLPGGGVDPGETPAAAVVREVWEETGQDVVDVELVAVSTVHRTSPPGSASTWDFHAVRLLHLARCDRPTEPVVHDIGGSTARAEWVASAALAELSLAPWCADFLR